MCENGLRSVVRREIGAETLPGLTGGATDGNGVTGPRDRFDCVGRFVAVACASVV
jgi:hypothetical protein